MDSRWLPFTRPPTSLALVALLAAVSALFAANAIVNPLNTDLVATLTGARLLSVSPHSLYDAVAQRLTQQGIVHQPIGRADAYLELPIVAFLMQPLLRLPIQGATAVVVALSAIAIGMSAAVAWRHLGLRRLGWGGVSLIALAALSLPAAWNYWLVQVDALLLLPAVVAAALMRRGHGFLAGLTMSILVVKPQVIWLVPVVLIICRQWRTLLGLAAGAAVMAGVSVALISPQQVVAWVHLVSTQGPAVATSIGLPGVVAMVGGDHVALPALAAMTLATLFAAWRLRRRLRADPVFALGLSLAVSGLLAPHYFSYDLVLMLVPLSLLALRRLELALLCGVLLNLGYLVDHYLLGSGGPGETAALLVLCCVMARRAASDGGARDVVQHVETPPEPRQRRGHRLVALAGAAIVLVGLTGCGASSAAAPMMTVTTVACDGSTTTTVTSAPTEGSGGGVAPVVIVPSTGRGLITPSPPPTPRVIRSSSVPLTEADGASTIVVSVGTAVRVRLGPATPPFCWSAPTTTEGRILEQLSSTSRNDRSALGSFRARAAGRVMLQANMNPRCFPPCGAPSMWWRVDILVTA